MKGRMAITAPRRLNRKRFVRLVRSEYGRGVVRTTRTPDKRLHAWFSGRHVQGKTWMEVAQADPVLALALTRKRESLAAGRALHDMRHRSALDAVSV